MKKSLLIFIIVIISINPLIVAAGQEVNVRPLDNQLLEGFSRNINDSWGEAMAIWTGMYNSARSIWQQQVVWRAQPIWARISKQIEDWSNRQITTLREIFRRDTEKTRETIKKETTETGREVSKSLWQRILEGLGVQ